LISIPHATPPSATSTLSLHDALPILNDTTSGADLAAKKLPELQAIAAGLGIKGARRLRKGELIDAIRGGGAPTASAASAPAASSDRKSTRLNSSHVKISYAVFCLKKK